MAEPDPDPKLTIADPKDLSDTLSFALRFEGKRRYNDSDRFAADIIADRLVRHLDRCGYVWPAAGFVDRQLS
jgi:hypothetical protein